MKPLPIVVGRSCGGCTACCKTHAADVWKAKGGEYCDRCQIGVGCSIYEDRPEGCRTFKCHWLRGAGEESDRPDRLKVVVTSQHLSFRGRDITVMGLWEVEGDTLHVPRVRQMIVRAIKSGFVVVRRPYGQQPFYHFPADAFSEEEYGLVVELVERHLRGQ